MATNQSQKWNFYHSYFQFSFRETWSQHIWFQTVGVWGGLELGLTLNVNDVIFEFSRKIQKNFQSLNFLGNYW